MSPALREYGNFLDKITTINLHIQFAEQSAETFQQSIVESFRDGGGLLADALQVLTNVVAAAEAIPEPWPGLLPA